MWNILKIDQSDLACPNCKHDIGNSLPENQTPFPTMADIFPEHLIHSTGSIDSVEFPNQCPGCALPIDITKGENSQILRISYPADRLLAASNRMEYITWKLRQLNGWISVSLLTKASCSVSGNSGAAKFKEFIIDEVERSKFILDVGCGSQNIPLYLDVDSSETKKLVGIDPFPSDFAGTLVNGSAEHLPLADAIVDLAICASSIDHFMNLDLALQEISRVLCIKGKLAIWDHAGNIPPVTKLTLIDKIKNVFRKPIENLRIYDNGVMFKIESDSDDPFHTSASRSPNWVKELDNKLSHLGFELLESKRDLGFSLWEKGSSAI